jgi:hypothetical protein
MKTGKCFVMITAVAALFMISAQAQAYSISGCWITPGNSTAVGSLYSILDPSCYVNPGWQHDDILDPSYHYGDGIKNSFERDYVLVTGANGTVAFSGGEIDAYVGNKSINLLSNGLGGFNLNSYDSRDVTGVTSISVIHAINATSGTKAYASSLTVSGSGITSTTRTDAQLAALGFTAGSSATLINLLSAYGVNANNLNLNNMILFNTMDNYPTILSVGELLSAASPDMGNFYALGSPGNGYMRLMTPTGDLHGSRSVSNVTSILIMAPIPTPIPASLFLFAPAILGLIGLKRKRILN